MVSAESLHLCWFLWFPFQWIATINNISKRIYLSENAEVRSLENKYKHALLAVEEG